MTRPLKILCLHGYRQSGEQFRTKTGGFRKLFKKKCEYVFINAPHFIPETEDRGWWFSQSEKTYDATEISSIDVGFEETLNSVASELKSQGPFDGILSFSQGACLASVICMLKAKGDERFQDFGFAIIAAGYRSRTEQHQSYYSKESKIEFPTLHIIGDSDQVIKREMSDDLVGDYFDEKVTVIARHPDGHILPTKGECKATIVDFINKRHAEANA